MVGFGVRRILRGKVPPLDPTHRGRAPGTAGSNPERLESEAAFAALCRVNPIPASSGKTSRHRLKASHTVTESPETAICQAQA